MSTRGVHQVSSRRYGLLRGAWRRPPLSTRGLHQGRCWRWHAPLQGAWGRPPLSARGLHQVSARQHWLLHGAWGRQALSRRGLHQVGCRDHGLLRGPWRRQGLPVRRLRYRSSNRRVLQSAWQAVPAAGLHQASSSRVLVLPSMCSSRKFGHRFRPGASTCRQVHPSMDLTRTFGDSHRWRPTRRPSG